MKRVAVAFLVLIGLLALWQGLQRQKAAQEEAEQASKDLLPQSLDNVQRVAIWRAKKKPQTLTFEKRDGRWLIVAPIRWRGNDVTLDGLVDQFDERSWKQAIEADDPAPFGLRPPQFAVTFVADGVTTVVRIGRRAPVGNVRYVMVGDDPRIYAVPSGFTYNLEKNLDDYRSRDVFDAFPERLSAVVAVSDAATLEVTSPDGEYWYIGRERADDDEVRSWVNRIRGLRIRTFLDKEDPEWRPQRKLIVRTADGRVFELLFAETVPNEQAVRMRLPDGRNWVTISSYSFDGLWKQRSELLPPPPSPVTGESAAMTTAMTPLSSP